MLEIDEEMTGNEMRVQQRARLIKPQLPSSLSCETESTSPAKERGDSGLHAPSEHAPGFSGLQLSTGKLISQQPPKCSEEHKITHNPHLLAPSEPPSKCSCSRGTAWACEHACRWVLQVDSAFDIEECEREYQRWTGEEAESGSEGIISRDLNRTFPSVAYFNTQHGLAELERVLVAYAKSNRAIGYVQGMNFIVAALTFHCREDVAFWLFVRLLEDYRLRQVYRPGLPGLYEDSRVIGLLLQDQERELADTFR